MKCGRDNIPEIALELYKPGQASAYASDFRIDYLTGGKERSSTIGFGFGLCGKDLDSGACNLFP